MLLWEGSDPNRPWRQLRREVPGCLAGWGSLAIVVSHATCEINEMGLGTYRLSS